MCRVDCFMSVININITEHNEDNCYIILNIAILPDKLSNVLNIINFTNNSKRLLII